MTLLDVLRAVPPLSKTIYVTLTCIMDVNVHTTINMPLAWRASISGILVRLQGDTILKTTLKLDNGRVTTRKSLEIQSPPLFRRKAPTQF
jgi:hypothetical protein